MTKKPPYRVKPHTPGAGRDAGEARPPEFVGDGAVCICLSCDGYGFRYPYPSGSQVCATCNGAGRTAPEGGQKRGPDPDRADPRDEP